MGLARISNSVSRMFPPRMNARSAYRKADIRAHPSWLDLSVQYRPGEELEEHVFPAVQARTKPMGHFLGIALPRIQLEYGFSGSMRSTSSKRTEPGGLTNNRGDWAVGINACVRF